MYKGTYILISLQIAIVTFVTLEKPTDKFSNLRLYKLCWTAWYYSSLCEYDNL